MDPQGVGVERVAFEDPGRGIPARSRAGSVRGAVAWRFREPGPRKRDRPDDHGVRPSQRRSLPGQARCPRRRGAAGAGRGKTHKIAGTRPGSQAKVPENRSWSATRIRSRSRGIDVVGPIDQPPVSGLRPGVATRRWTLGTGLRLARRRPVAAPELTAARRSRQILVVVLFLVLVEVVDPRPRRGLIVILVDIDVVDLLIDLVVDVLVVVEFVVVEVVLVVEIVVEVVVLLFDLVVERLPRLRDAGRSGEEPDDRPRRICRGSVRRVSPAFPDGPT